MSSNEAPILVTCPTGNIGRQLVPRLLDAGASVRLFLRSPDALPPDHRSQVTLVQGNLEDPAAVQRAVEGVVAAFFLVPINFQADSFDAWYRTLSTVFCDAIRAEGPVRVLFVSSGGAQRGDLGPVSALGTVERMLEDATPHVVHLRTAYFMENLWAMVPTIASDSVFYGAFAPDTAIPMVATADIAEVAARWLTDASWEGRHVVGVHGAADRTMSHVATALTEALGHPVRYQQIPPSAVAQALQQIVGASDGTAADYEAMVAGLEHHGADYKAEPRTDSTTTPTTLEDFVQEVLAPAIRAQSETGHPTTPA